MVWVNKINATVLFREKEGLVEFFLQSLQVDIKVLRHDHVLIKPVENLATLIDQLGTAFNEENLEVVSQALYNKGCSEFLITWLIRDLGQEESNLEVFNCNIERFILSAVVLKLPRCNVVNTHVGFGYAIFRVNSRYLIDLVLNQHKLVL